jgi:hypothetical protein
LWPAGIALLLLAADIGVSVAQQLPPGGGPLPQLRRGADGQIEMVPPETPARPATGPRAAAPATVAPEAATSKAGAPKTMPPKLNSHPSAAAIQRPTRVPPQPVITVVPERPTVSDTAPLGTVVARYSIRMSDGSRFSGNVRFGPPFYDGKGSFALAGDRVIVNPNGPGLGPNKTTITRYFTLEAVP